jgi:triosephosphate isomerase
VHNNNGAYTGEVSASMLSDLGCKYVIVGHSERRIYFKETDELVANKTKTALQNNLTPIVCIGETLEHRQSNQTFNILEIQLKAILDILDNEQIPNIILAYEPVWAIGTGQSATKERAQEVDFYLRKICLEYNKISPSILYGGSVKANNAKEIFAMQDIDGGLIGGASLIADEFLAISNSLYL